MSGRRRDCKFAKKVFSRLARMCFFLGSTMHRSANPKSDLKNRLLYGAVVGAILGMIIGTLPTSDPIAGLLGMGLSAVVIAALAALSESFWESLRAAWELVRISFWRW
jgi:hypothetical protein